MIELITQLLWLIFHTALGDASWGDGALAAFEAVLNYEHFAGALWTGPDGYAQPWARLVDDLLDWLLLLQGFDPQVVRGDH